ncbi:MAG: long-chain-fatty-acid--CoA ligase [Fuerstiella sp.]|nr:long-chain-fatty-acid--CoA ligase [Fuerstiella sp.]
MQNDPFNLVQILEHAGRFHAQVEIVTRCVEDDSIQRSNYGEAAARTRQLANALKRMNIRTGDRIGTLAWNTQRHLEAWYAISGQGAICHTINPRLFVEQIEYIVNHAGDRILLIDPPFVPLLEQLQERLPTVERYIVLTDNEHMPDTNLRNAVPSESLISAESADYHWPTLSYETPAGLCYTSGTTGNPKGVQYTHRSNLLHAYGVSGADGAGISSTETVLMVVPMFHANSWGLAYACPMAGAPLILPGARLDGESIHELLDSEKVTFSAAVPTVWNMLLSYMKTNELHLPYLSEVLIGGSAVPRHLIETFDKDYGVTVLQAWGMTELSPLGTVCRLKADMIDWSYERQIAVRLKQGKPIFGCNLKIVDDDNKQLPHDGQAVGRLLVKGPWVVRRYYKDEHDAVDADGWFDTGDIANIDQYGYLQITDRAKDLIKSGGEWISSVDLENEAMGHTEVQLAAVIGVSHPKWEERPLLVVIRKEDSDLSRDEILTYLSDKVARWWLPDDVVFVDEIPMTATGKISKLRLREQLSDYRLPNQPT